MFKDIVSHQEGQNLFPGLLTNIKGSDGATPITTKGNKPMIGVTADGAFQMVPNMEYGVKSNSVLEIPTAQMGGTQQDMIMKLIVAYAQSRGQDPKQLMAQLQQLPQDQQQQAIQAIAQSMQQEQQQPMAQKGKQVETSLTDRLKDAYVKTLPYSISQSQQQPMQSIDWNSIGNSIGKGLNQFMKTSPLGPLFSAPVILPPDLYPQEQYLGEGGEPCTDCQEQYPQAQNLNWFYKAQGGTAYMMDDLYKAGGEAYPQANTYPESWVGYNGTAYAQGGSTEVYPQAQMYLPNEKSHETRPNFMVEYGGQTIDDIYQMMKKGGLNVDAKKKKGGELSQESFAKYLMKNGGYLPKHQINGIVGVPNSMLNGSILNDYYNTYNTSGQTFPEGTTYDAATNTMISPEKFKEINPNANPTSIEYWEPTSDKNFELFKIRRDNDDILYEQSLNYNNTPTVTPTTSTAATTQTQVDPIVDATTLNPPGQIVDDMSYDPYDFSQGKVKRLENRWNRQQKREANREARYQEREQKKADVPMASKSSSNKQTGKYPYYNYGVTMPEAAAIMGQSSKSPFLKKLAAGINIAGAFNTLAGDPLGMDRAYIGRNGGVLPKHQIIGTTGTSWTPSGAFQGVNQFMPAPMQMETAEDMGWDAYNKSNPMASYESYLGANQTKTAAGDAVSFRPGSTADPANPNYQAPAGPESMGPKKRKQRGDIIGSMRAVNALGAAGSLLAEVEKEKELKKLRGKVNTTDRAFQVNPDIDRGDYLTNVTQGPSFRPDQYAYAQKQAGYTEQAPLFWTKMGGGIPELEDGMEIDLSMYDEPTQREIIYSIYAAGGSVEYI